MEMISASASAAMLLAGLGATLFLSARALDGASSRASQSRAAEQVIAELAAEAKYGQVITTRTDRALAVQSPDPDPDKPAITTSWSWSGVTGEPLRLQRETATAGNLLEHVQSLALSYRTRPVTGTGFCKGVRGQVVYRGLNGNLAPYSTNSLTIGRVPDTAAGDLLVAAIIVAGNGGANPFNTPLGWTLIAGVNYQNQAHLAVYYKIALIELTNYTFTWGGAGRRAGGSVLRFTGHDPNAPINAAANQGGTAVQPVCPGVTTTVDNCLILRIGSFDDRRVTLGSTGLANHTSLLMQFIDLSADTASGGVGYCTQEVAGAVPTATFQLTGSQEYVTMTVAIAPAP